MRALTISLVLCLVLQASVSIAAGGISLTQRKAIQSVNAAVSQAGTRFAAGDFEAAGQSIRAAIEQVESAEAGRSVEVYEELLPAMKRINKAHTMLQFEGVSLPPFRIPPRPTAKVATVPVDAMKPRPSPAVPKPSKPSDAPENGVSFAKDIAPILVNNCNGCHIDAMQTRGGLRMDTFATLLRGGDSGPAIQPGKGDASLLVQKLRGMQGARMPAGGRPALSDEAIQRISTWIDEGATLDGASESQPLGVMSQLAWAASASDEEVSAKRNELSKVNLQLANAVGAAVSERTTEHFYIVGTASEATLELVAKLAESQMKMVQSVVSDESGEGFYGGRVTIFVMPRRYDYSEFAKMVESRSLPTDWSSHWQFDGIDAYVAMVATDRDDEEQLAGRLLGPLTALAVATRGGDVPRWLAEGVGVATAARTRGMDRDQRRRMEAEVSNAVAAIDNAKKFLDGKMTPEQSDRIGAAIATALLDRSNRRNFDRCMRLLDQGKPFEAAFAESFGMSTVVFVDAWIRWVRG